MQPVRFTSLRFIAVSENVRVVVRELVKVRARCLLRAWCVFAVIVNHDIDIIVVEIVESHTLLLIARKSCGGFVDVRVFRKRIVRAMSGVVLV